MIMVKGVLELNSLKNEILQSYTVFTRLDSSTLNSIIEKTFVYEANANKLCFSKDECQGFTLILDGILRIQYMSENGRELTVYRLGRGDYCHLTIIRLLYGKEINFEVFSEKSMRLAIIPREVFIKHLAGNPVFLREIYADLHEKLDALYKVINDIGFESVESRLIAYFKGKSRLSGSSVFELTREQIGIDIGATREAVTRTLLKMEKEGMVKLSRKKIEWLGRR
ncbi:MAG: Crp/Fnr family transcriptional regulator [Bacillota bacterium]